MHSNCMRMFNPAGPQSQSYINAYNPRLINLGTHIVDNVSGTLIESPY
jgi:hypothetical protein